MTAWSPKSGPIYVTRPTLPPLEEFVPMLQQLWDNRWLTNQGPFHEQFEKKLAEFLGVPYVSLFCNGMMALQIGLQALKITGEVITTPFSFVATTHAIYWNGCTPVFSDISPDDYNLDPDKIESAITPRTTAIMPVHVYGNPCKLKKLQKIADTYGLKLFYDAAHTFNVKMDGQSILRAGDLSMISFHATKIFNTFEGGALITEDRKLKQRIDFLKNFGFADEVTVVAPGSNGKMDEFRSAFGMLQLRYVDQRIAANHEVTNFYREQLRDIPGIHFFQDMPGVTHNYSYFPITVDEAEYGLSRDGLYDELKKSNIFTRRYFYPLISAFPCYRHLPSALPGNLPVAERVAKQILCLPIYADLPPEARETVADVIRRHRR